MRTRVRFSVFAAVLLALAGCGRSKDIAPDLAFNFRCHGAVYPAREVVIEKFLHDHGFRAFNEERIRRQYHLWLYPMAIDGYDANRRMADFRGINEKPSQPVQEATMIYSVGIYSPPPTRHDSKFETAAIDFVSKTLKCDVSQISHGENSEAQAQQYDDIYATEQRRMHEALRCDKESGKPLDSDCPA